MENRASGFYWVTLNDGEWHVAKYNSEDKLWTFCGVEIMVDEVEIDRVYEYNLIYVFEHKKKEEYRLKSVKVFAEMFVKRNVIDWIQKRIDHYFSTKTKFEVASENAGEDSQINDWIEIPDYKIAAFKEVIAFVEAKSTDDLRCTLKEYLNFEDELLNEKTQIDCAGNSGGVG